MLLLQRPVHQADVHVPWGRRAMAMRVNARWELR